MSTNRTPPMLPDEVRKAVERDWSVAMENAGVLRSLSKLDKRFDKLAHIADQLIELCADRRTLSAHLLAREAEVARLRERVKHTQQWYAERFERMKDLGKQQGCWPEMAAIMANGSLSGFVKDGEIQYEPPTYAQQMSRLRHRAERAEALLLDVLGSYCASPALHSRITAHLSENSRG